MNHDITSKFQEFFIGYRLTKNIDIKTRLNIAVLCSGGVDSAVLLFLANIYKVKFNYNVTVLHVQFDDFKSSQSATDIVKNSAHEYNFRCISNKSNLGKLTSNLKITARKEMKEISFIEPFDLVLTGHQKDDQVETILNRLLRGAGPSGLMGMSFLSTFKLYEEERTFAKPLLNVTKKEIIDYASKMFIPWVDDESNSDTDVSDRNFIRNEILPKLSERFDVYNIANSGMHISEFMDTRHISLSTLDIRSGVWDISDFINLSIGNRLLLIKEHMKQVHGFTLNSRITQHLKNILSSDISNMKVAMVGNVKLELVKGAIVITNAQT